MVIGLLPQPPISEYWNMTLRFALAAVLALGVAGLSSPVSAQIFFPGRPVAVAPPPLDVPDNDNDDLVEAAPPIEAGPLAAPDGRAAAPSYALPPNTPYPNPPPLALPPSGSAAAPLIAPAPPVELTAPVVVPSQPAMPPALAARPSDGAPRPPADVDADKPTASLPANTLPPEYQPETGAKKELPPHLRRQQVEYWTKEPAGTIVIDTPNTYLYLVLGEGKAMRYGVGVGREGFTWTGREKITRMTEWPDWFPPSEMIERQPYLPRFMAGGESNPMGARALYLGKTLYRIHGTNQPSTIGTFVSSGCVRLVNDDIADLYQRVKVGTKVVVLPGNPTAAAKPAPQTAATPAPVTAR
jgi:lipoprotein-anchoring transpeptidase ErfK/SrfK